MLGHLTYLVLELVWAGPVLLLQWMVGGRRLWSCRRILLAAVAIPTCYLCVADSLAIAQGIWAIHSQRILGLRLGVLPLEEAIFFLLTNAMVAQSVLLIGPDSGRW